jgi:hypothetical protein
MNKIFIDTEFTDFVQMDLISLGAITEDGKHQFYVELCDYEKSWESEWVKENVIPLLHTDGLNHYQAGLNLYKWFKGLPRQPDGYVICIDYDSDWHHMIDLLDGQDPQNIQEEPSYVTSALYAEILIHNAQSNIQDVNQVFHECQNFYAESFLDYMFENKLIQHHALNDAKGNRFAWLETLKFIRK